MRNIFLLPTKDGVDSDLFYHCLVGCEKTLQYKTEDKIRRKEMIKAGINQPQFVYITCDNAVLNKDWFIFNAANKLLLLQAKQVKNNIIIIDYNNEVGSWIDSKYCHKVALTNDPALIKDDVQQVSIDFMQWYIKNHTCEYVNVINNDYLLWKNSNVDKLAECYSILIPQEESKQDLIESAAEAAYKFESDSSFPDEHAHKEFIRIFKKGANKQKEFTRYSEDDMIEFSKWRVSYHASNLVNTKNSIELLQMWLEQTNSQRC